MFGMRCDAFQSLLWGVSTADKTICNRGHFDFGVASFSWFGPAMLVQIDFDPVVRRLADICGYLLMALGAKCPWCTDVLHASHHRDAILSLVTIPFISTPWPKEEQKREHTKFPTQRRWPRSPSQWSFLLGRRSKTHLWPSW